MAGWKNDGGKGKKPEGRGGGGARAGHGWKAGEEKAPGAGKRKFVAAAVGLLCMTAAAAIVYFFFFLQKNPRPTLIIFANNPVHFATKLDVPMDLAGWQGAKLLIEQAKRRNELDKEGTWGKTGPLLKLADDGNSPRSVPAGDEEIADWVKTVEDAECNPLIIYFGTHTGTDREGPYLYSHNGRHLPLRKIVEVLGKGPLRDKKKIVLLDPGRRAPRFAEGRILDEFSEAVQAMNAEIAACPNLMVILGCDKGERGWDSEELQATPLALAMAEALNGEGGISADNRVIDGKEFFTHIQNWVSNWTQTNRPRASKPVLLPLEFNAAGIELSAKPPNPAEPRAKNADLNEAKLRAAWKAHEDLAKTKEPQAYSPMLLRRWRELLLRYDAAVRVNETPTADRLRVELDLCEKTLRERGQWLGAVASRDHSAALRRALGEAVPKLSDELLGDDEAKLQKATVPERIALLELRLSEMKNGAGTPKDRLRKAEILRKLFPADARPVEAHLPVMVQSFYADHAPGAEVPKEWFDAMSTRADLERALFAADQGPMYVERLREEIESQIAALDDLRRGAEDRLFSGDPKHHADALTRLNEINGKLAAIEAKTTALRKLLAERDEIFADGPYLAEWQALNTVNAKLSLNMAEVWESFNAAAVKLDQSGAEPPDFQTMVSLHRNLQGDLEKFAREAPNIPVIQENWYRVQLALESPVLTADLRMGLLRASRKMSLELLKPGEKQATKTGGSGGDSPAVMAQARLRLARSILGNDLIANRSMSDSSLAKVEYFKPLDAKDFTIEKAGDMAVALSDHLRGINSLGSTSKTLAPGHERHTRLACATSSDAKLEPAGANQRLRWAALLRSQAERTAKDRWLDESTPGKRWYNSVADNYLKDAESVVKVMEITHDNAAIAALLKAGNLTAEATPAKLEWTTEPSREFSFALKADDKFPIEGLAVAIADLTKLEPFKLVDNDNVGKRPLVTLKPNETCKPLKLTVETGKADEGLIRKTAAGKFYFRGQTVSGGVELVMNRQADLILVEPKAKPGESDLTMAVRAGPDLDSSEIVIILDYSGSMSWSMDGKDRPAVKKELSRKEKALSALRTALAPLTYGTRLKVRIFLDVDKKEKFILVRHATQDTDRVSWKPGAMEPLDQLIGKLRDYEPEGLTPLVDRIGETLKNGDFAAEATHRKKVLLVITDGSDNPKDVPEGEEKEAPHLEKQNGRLRAAFKDKDISLTVVLFAISDEKDDKQKRTSERERARKLFDGVGNAEHPSLILEAGDEKKLAEHLLETLRPRLRLEDGGASAEGLRNSGVYVQPYKEFKKPEDADYLFWTPLFKVHRQSDHFKLIPVPGNGQQQFKAAAGDRIFLEMTTKNDRTVLRRDTFTDYYPADLKAVRGDWAMLVPPVLYVEKNEKDRLTGTVFLENLPPHKRGAPESFEEKFAVPQPGLKSDFLWWDIQPVGGKAGGAVRITRLYGHTMPAWAIDAKNWPGTDDPRVFRAAKVEAWVDPNPNVIEKVKVPLKKPLPVPGAEAIVLNADYEPHPFEAQSGKKYLVVRLTTGDRGPVYLRLRHPVGDSETVEHRYFHTAKSCTAVFGPFDENAFASGPPEFDVVLAEKTRQNGQSLKVETKPLGTDLIRQPEPLMTKPATP